MTKGRHKSNKDSYTCKSYKSNIASIIWVFVVIGMNIALQISKNSKRSH